MGILGKAKRMFRDVVGEVVRTELNRPATGIAPHRTVIDTIKFESGVIQETVLRNRPIDDLDTHRYRVFSQFDQDGLIQWLVRNVPIERELFIEIGIEDYRQSNTRFLLEHSHWSGAVFDCDDSSLAETITSGYRMIFDIDFTKAFIDRETINDVLKPYAGDVGLLSIDIDGMEYWVIEAMEIVRPRILIIEYQSLFGPELDVAVPYDPRFVRRNLHPSMLVFGASLSALNRLAESKGYKLVAGVSHHHEAIWVRHDVLGDIPTKRVEDVYVSTRYRESRDADYRPTYIGPMIDRRRHVKEVQLHNFKTGQLETIGSLFGL